ncbi:MAG: restriction endonuclease [Candidatus Hydrogenedens sp.]|nr:restriction endonuclease [Candidatus Hydrogenedens sp.]
MTRKEKRVREALQVLADLGLPRAQQNDRSALCLLAMLDLAANMPWSEAGSPLLGITPVMDWIRKHYNRDYAPNTRETFRRQTMHQFYDAGLVLYNPDKLDRPVNSPKAVYQVSPRALSLLRTYGSETWKSELAHYLSEHESLTERYSAERSQHRVPVRYNMGDEITLSPGAHSELIKAIVTEFAQRFAPGSDVVYIGDTEDKWGYFDSDLLASLGVEVDAHGKMPDVVLNFSARKWLVLIEAVTSHGPVDGKRHAELRKLFGGSSAGLVFVTAFPDRRAMSKYLGNIAWETEVWVADAPSHLIHFNGERFLGPYSDA